jgi:lactoylglutathione lyase
MKLSQIRLMVNDFHQSVAFYKEVMGFPLGVSAEEMQFASFNTGETKLEIFSRQNMVEEIGEDKLLISGQSPSKFLLAFAVDHVDEACARLKEKGIVLINEPHDRKDWNARVAHIRDPDGNVIEIYKHPL